MGKSYGHSLLPTAREQMTYYNLITSRSDLVTITASTRSCFEMTIQGMASCLFLNLSLHDMLAMP